MTCVRVEKGSGLYLRAGGGRSRPRGRKAGDIKRTARLIHIEEVLKNGGTQEKGFQGTA